MDALRKLFKPRSKGSINVLVVRFLHVFEAHGIDTSKIPRLLSQIRYEDLEPANRLLAALTPAVIDTTAKLFGVRPEWLEGQDDRVYNLLWARKDPRRFLSQFASALAQSSQKSWFLLRVLTTSRKLDRNAEFSQLLVPIIVETTGTVGEDNLYRCQVYGDYYDWTDPASRIELKALALLVFRHSKIPIPLFLVTPKEMERFTDGVAIPSIVWRRGLVTSPSLEDFILSSKSSAVAKESDELPAVLSYLETQGLSNFTFPASPLSDAPLEPDVALETVEVLLPVMAQKSSPGKRQTQKDQWSSIFIAAQSGWSEDPTATITAMVQRLQKMPHLKASALGESAIRKHIRDAAPPEVRGKPGRKPKQST